MPSHSLLRTPLGALFLLVLLVAAPAVALPQLYDIVRDESDVRTRTRIRTNVDAEPDLLSTFPQSSTLTGVSNNRPSNLSTATADVGLPGNFDDGANGITFSDLVIDLPAAGNLSGGGQITVPLSITGSPAQDIAFFGSIGSFQIMLDDPFNAPLVASGNPNEFLWAGLANVTISGIFFPTMTIPSDTVPPVPLDPVPFSQAATLALAGTFSGDFSGTRLTVGFPVDGVDDLDLSTDPVSESIDLLDLGLVTLDISYEDLILAELTGAVVYENSVPIPEPGTAGLLALGLAGLAARRRSRF